MSNIIIIDNFYPDLNWLPAHLDSHNPEKRNNVNYAGVVYPAPLEQTEYAFNKIKQVLNLKEDLPKVGQGEIRLTVASDDRDYRSLIHADPTYNVVVYLSGEEGNHAGTHFYKHKEMGLIGIPDDKLMEKKISFLLSIDSKFVDRWELIEQVAFKANRAILFDGKFFHSVPPVFKGSGVKDGRITQNFFFQNLLRG